MKKTIIFAVLTALLICTISVYAIALPENGVIMKIGSTKASVNGEFKSMGDISPILCDGRTMLPLRFCAEALDAEVLWVHESNTAIVKKDGKVIEFTLGNKVYKNNGQLIETDIAPMLYNNSTMIPLRVLAEALEETVNWYDDAQAVTINIQGDEAVVSEYCKVIFE